LAGAGEHFAKAAPNLTGTLNSVVITARTLSAQQKTATVFCWRQRD
jgi:hypothetical protein